MNPDGLIVWIEVLPPDSQLRSGVLCRRHADAMIVPRGWTLDDRREAKPRLFRVSEPPLVDNRPPRRPRKPRTDTSARDQQQQFDLGETSELTVAEIRPLPSDSDETRAMPWSFVYDESDDLDGLLSTTSPLLSRAFRGRATAPQPQSQGAVEQ